MKKFVQWKDNVAISLLPKIVPNYTENFSEFVLRNVNQVDKNKVAITDANSKRSITFGELKNNVLRVKQNIGVKKDSVVTIYSPNHVDYFSAIHGVISSGAIISPVNPAYTHEELQFQMSNSNSETIIAHEQCLENVLKAKQKTKISKIYVLEDNDSSVITQKQQDLYEKNELISFSSLLKKKIDVTTTDLFKFDGFHTNDVCALPYSSGTTGLPKGTMLTHNNLISNILQCYEVQSKFFKKNDVIMSPLPMFHIYAFLVSLNLSIYHGNSFITMSKFDLELFCKTVQEYKVNRTQIVPPIILQLSKSPIVDKYDLSSLKQVLSAAAPLGLLTEKQCAERLKCKVVQAWGLTELSPIATCTPDDSDKPGSGTVGIICASTECKVVDPQSGEVLPPNREGELLVRGPQVMKGYFKEPEKTKQCLSEDGWLKTGDIAVIDDDGYVYIRERLKELIKYKGLQVAPAALEEVLVTITWLLTIQSLLYSTVLHQLPTFL